MLHMNRKNKIIVSIVGISIISLALIGLTYGYYLTRIQGNTNNKSISISTANLELTYSDNSDVITGTNIVPGTTLGTKTFTVTNNGDNNVDSYSVGLVNVINTFIRLDDIKYKVTCSSSVTGKTCNGVSETTFPNENSYIIENQINKNEVQTYVIEVEYKEMNVDQSVDMGKTLEAKIDIFDTKSLTIKGTVTNYSENDYVVINSKEQTSEIVDGKYKFIGIEPDTHKITIKNRKTTTTKQTTLNVSKGEPAASGSNITYNDEKNIADANITITGSTVTIDVTKISADDTTPPTDALIVVNEEFPQITSTLKATITQSDKDSEINLNNSKWLINKESTKLKDKIGYTWNTFTSNPETIDISKKEPGVYYLHIISSDSSDNITETIKLISILPEYDTSKNDTSTITESGKIWTEGDGTSDKPYLISSIENLKYLSYKVNSGTKYTNTYFALKNDINTSGALLEKPIGYNPNKYFDGIFDGNNYTLNTGDIYANNFCGLFGVTGPNSKIKKIKLNSITFNGSSFVGVIGYNMGNVLEINSNSNTFNIGNYGSGLVGFNDGEIYNSTVDGIIQGTGSYIGGITGYNNYKLNNIKLSDTNISGVSYVGGLTGMTAGIITGSNTLSASDITLSNSYGGLAAGYNKGTIDGVNISSAKATGFTGGLNGLTGVNEGTITSNNYVEGEQYTGN